MLGGWPQDEEADMEEVLTTRKRKMDDLLETGDEWLETGDECSKMLHSRAGSDELQFEIMLMDLLGLPGFYKFDILYSRRYRWEVLRILNFARRIVRRRYYRRRSDGDTSSDEEDDEDSDDDVDISVLRNWFSRLAKCEKLLKAYETKVGTCWRSLCYPCAPDERYRRRDQLKPLKRILFPVLGGKKQEGAFDVDYVRSLDVFRLLGHVLVDQNGDKRFVQEACSGKFVFVCCINAPVLFAFKAFQSLITLCNELCSERGDVQVVMVAKMNILADTRQVFDHLFSAFPRSCLAVPYNKGRLEEVARLLSRGTDLLPRCVAYGLDGRFLESFCAINYISFPYGAEAFPFTEEKVKKVLKQRMQLRTDRLENLLRPYEWSQPDDVVVYDFEKRTRPILEVVKNKHVGLYLCSDGSLFRRLLKLCMHCNSKELEFEIVVLYLPQLSEADRHTFEEMRADGLASHKVRGWWRLPFNNSVSLRFYHLTEDYDIGDDGCMEDWEDKLIIVGPDGKILDMYGAQAIKRDNRFDAHPFTRAAVVKNWMRQVRDVKLESLVAGRFFYRGDDPNHEISARTLLKSKKKIIIYFEMPERMKDDNLGALVSQYEEMRKNGDEFEVVIIDFDCSRRAGVDANKFRAIPWLICCRPHTYIQEKLRKVVKVESLVGFGEDGRICSVKPLHTSDTARLCLEETLYTDLYQHYQFDQCSPI